MKAYSIDLRQKILDTYHAEPISQKAIAKRFSGASEFCTKLLKQYRETKNITPRTDRCGVKGKLNAEQLLILAELIEANNDATLEELRYLLYGRIGSLLVVYFQMTVLKLSSYCCIILGNWYKSRFSVHPPPEGDERTLLSHPWRSPDPGSAGGIGRTIRTSA